MLADRTPRTILGAPFMRLRMGGDVPPPSSPGAPFMRLRMGGDVPPPSSRDDHQRPTVVLKGTAHGRNGFSRAINQPPRSGYRSAEGSPLGRTSPPLTSPQLLCIAPAAHSAKAAANS